NRKMAGVCEAKNCPDPIAEGPLKKRSPVGALIIEACSAGHKQHLAAGAAQPVVEVHILVARQSLVESAQFEQLFLPAAEEWHHIYSLGLGQIDVSITRPANPESMRHALCDGFTPQAVVARDTTPDPAHVIGIVKFQRLNAPANVLRRIYGMRIDPHHNFAPAGRDSDI